VLKLRLITAAILIPILVACIIWLPIPYFDLLIAVVATLGAWEWTRFMQLATPAQRIFYLVIFVLALGSSWFVKMQYPDYVSYILYMALLWWFCAFLLIITYPQHESLRRNVLITGLIGLFVLVPCWLSIVVLRDEFQHGVYLVLYIFTIIAIADSGAYFGGRLWGRNKLAPKVSPGKTWEGVVSGMFCVVILALVCAKVLGLPLPDWRYVSSFVAISVVTGLFSIMGDLTESLFKRQVGLKDSGKILPGHGGILDRIDSMTAAAPLFVICIRWLYGGTNGALLPLPGTH